MVNGTESEKTLLWLLGSCPDDLFLHDDRFVVGSHGDVWFRGERPTTCRRCCEPPERGLLLFHAHGWTEKHLTTLRRGEFVRVLLHKARWRCVFCGATLHSRPENDLPYVRSSTLVVVLFLVASLVYGRDRGFNALPDTSSEVIDIRTVGRWFRRACDVSVYTHQFTREAVLERCEPRPVEELFRSGLSPPPEVLRRPWNELQPISRVWSSLTMISLTTKYQKVPTAQLLARARDIADAYSQPYLM